MNNINKDILKKYKVKYFKVKIQPLLFKSLLNK